MMEGAQDNAGRQAVLGDVFHSECAGRQIAEHVTGKWTPLIITALRGRTLRFYELRTAIDGVSEKMLSQKLRLLVRDGLIERIVEPSIPPKVSYRLTDLGRGIAGPLGGLWRWIAANAADVVAAQQRFDREA